MYHFRHHSDEVTGSIIGTILAAASNLIKNVIDLSWTEVFDTMILAAVGAVVGYLVTGILKWIKGLFGRKPKQP